MSQDMFERSMTADIHTAIGQPQQVAPTFKPAPQITDEDITWKFNRQAYELDITDADDRERFSACSDRLEEAEKKAPKDGTEAELVRRSYDRFCNYFDELFGAGAGVSLLGEKPNVRRIMNCRNSLLEHVSKVTDMMRAAAAYAPAKGAAAPVNRAQKRAVAKKKAE